MREIGIIRRLGNTEEPEIIAAELSVWFRERGIKVVIDQVKPGLDLLIILGGDGTLLHVAGEASRYGIPVVGINLGDLGFLTEVSKDERYEALEAILNNRFAIEHRLLLKTRIISGGQPSDWRMALNDVVISKGNIDRLIQLDSWANDNYITTYRADGLIFSTPTGATAYNLSAGGPIVHPALQSILITPICPFMLDSRPLLVAPETILTARLKDGRRQDVKVLVDGQSAWDIHQDDTIEIQASEYYLKLIASSKKDYFEILRNKLNWGSSIKNGRNPIR
ncbi:NAD kinase [hydrothermal vent metagenome]|uniref:NAD kinase n=1 Tax=hydrothermal vent metagenome TaxID=652676 RepID=A0A3B0VF23_9ZZZZ